MSKSANLAFHVIAIQKKVLPKARLDTALRQAEEQGVAIEGVLLDAGNLDLAGIERIAAIREKHGRPCAACSKTTYLLPGETPSKPCEHCGGALAGGGPPKGSPPKGAPAGSPAAPPKGPPKAAPKAPPPEGPPPKAAPKAPPPKAAPPDEPSPYDPPAPARPAPAPSDEASFVDEAPDPDAAPVPEPVPEPAPAPAPMPAPAPAPAPKGAPAGETDEEKKARLLKMRRSGIVIDPEPAATAPAATPAPAPTAPKPMQVVAVGPAPRAAPATPPPAAPADDDARFRPPGASRAPAILPGAVAGPPPVPPGKLLDEVPLILKLIASPRGLFMVSAAAFVAFLLQVVLDFAQRMPLAFMGLGPLAPLFVYVQGYLVRVTEAATKGEGELPDWPELGEGAGLGLRLFAAGLSAFLPALLLGFVALDWSSAPNVRSIGPNAVDMAGSTPIIPLGTAVGDAPFLRPEGEVVPMTGGWTVLGLLGRDMVDDTGMSETMADMPTGMMGVTIDWGAQIQDLDRVALALKGKSVRVFGAYADPDCRILHARYPSALPPTMRFERGRRALGSAPDPEPVHTGGDGGDQDEDGEELPRGADPSGELGRARELGAKATRATGAGPQVGADGQELEVKLQAVELLRTGDFTFPAPFNALKRYPAIYILDPSGTVRREYNAGVDDRKLYADVLDLMEGGNGDAKRRSLPAEAYGLKSKARSPVIQKVATIVFGALLLAGLFYYPMALLLTVVFTNASMGFRYPLAIGSIARTLPEYSIVAGLFIAIDLLGGALGLGFDRALRNALPGPLATFLGGYSQAWLVMYGATVCAWAMGRYYLRQQHELRWFAS